MLLKEKKGSYLVSRLVSENNIIEMGVYPVIFGMRVRAGYAGSPCCELDYCAGSSQEWLELLYSTIKNILESRLEDKLCFKDFPFQKIKPIFNDPECFMKLSSMVNGDIQVVKLPLINKLREEYFRENKI